MKTKAKFWYCEELRDCCVLVLFRYHMNKRASIAIYLEYFLLLLWVCCSVCILCHENLTVDATAQFRMFAKVANVESCYPGHSSEKVFAPPLTT